jgi:hypothetical protein
MAKTPALAEPDIQPYDPNRDSWDDLESTADVVQGSDLIRGDAADKLLGVPFVITRAVFREGVQRPGMDYRDDYVSCEAVVAPQEVLKDRARRGRLDLDEISVDPGEHIVFNDGSTGIYRQMVQYLCLKGMITLPDPINAEGGKGESSFDLPRSQWATGAEAGTAGFNIRLKCPRGLRYSDYTNEYNPDGSRTRYIG